MRAHIGPNGPDRCKAEVGNCPFGGDSGSDNHYHTLKEAKESYDAAMKSKFGEVASLKANKLKLSEREMVLREENAKLAKLVIELRGDTTEDLAFDDANVERSERRLNEAVDFAASRGNTHLASKLSSASVLPSGSFRRADGLAVNTDKVLEQKTIINHVEEQRAFALNVLTAAVRNSDLPVGTKAQYKDATGTYSLSVTTGVDEEAVAALPPRLLNAISSPKASLNIDLARAALSPEKFAAVTTQTLVTDFIMGKSKDEKLSLAPAKVGSVTTVADLEANAKNMADFYGSVRASQGDSVKSIKASLTAGQGAIKDAAASRGKNTFAPARSQSNGILVSSRRNLVAKEVMAQLTPEEIAAISEPGQAIDLNKAKAMLSLEDFGRIFEAKTISLRVTEK